MKSDTLSTLLALILVTPVYGAGADGTADAAKTPQSKKVEATRAIPLQPAQRIKPMARQEAKPAPPKERRGQVRIRKGLGGLNEPQLKEKMAATRKEIAENAKKHEKSHHDWVQAKKDAQALEDAVAKHKKALAELAKKAAENARKVKELEDVHAATEQAEGTLRAALVQQEKELARRAEIRKLEEQAAKLKAQAEALEKRAAELK